MQKTNIRIFAYEKSDKKVEIKAIELLPDEEKKLQKFVKLNGHISAHTLRNFLNSNNIQYIEIESMINDRH